MGGGSTSESPFELSVKSGDTDKTKEPVSKPDDVSKNISITAAEEVPSSHPDEDLPSDLPSSPKHESRTFPKIKLQGSDLHVPRHR